MILFDGTTNFPRRCLFCRLFLSKKYAYVKSEGGSEANHKNIGGAVRSNRALYGAENGVVLKGQSKEESDHDSLAASRARLNSSLDSSRACVADR